MAGQTPEQMRTRAQDMRTGSYAPFRELDADQWDQAANIVEAVQGMGSRLLREIRSERQPTTSRRRPLMPGTARLFA